MRQSKIKQNLLIRMHTFRNTLSQYLTRCNSLQVMAQTLRQNIARNKYFQCETVFERLDKYHKGYLVPEDFSQFLLENSIYPNQQQLYIIFRDFDTKKIGTVTLESFRNQVLPRENQKLLKQVINRKYYPSRERLQVDLEYHLTKYLEHKIKCHNELQKIRNSLHQLHPNYTQQAFIYLDKNKKTELTPSDIDYFLRSSTKLLKPEQIDRIFRVIGFIKDDSTPLLISYDKFMQHVNPFKCGFYLGYNERLLQKQQLERQLISRKLMLNESVYEKSRGQMKALVELQNLRNSRQQLQRQRLEQEIQMTKNRLVEQQLLRRSLYRY